MQFISRGRRPGTAVSAQEITDALIGIGRSVGRGFVDMKRSHDHTLHPLPRAASADQSLWVSVGSYLSAERGGAVSGMAAASVSANSLKAWL